MFSEAIEVPGCFQKTISLHGLFAKLYSQLEAFQPQRAAFTLLEIEELLAASKAPLPNDVLDQLVDAYSALAKLRRGIATAHMLAMQFPELSLRH